MGKYRLTYFDIRARAENSRMLFAQAGVEYEDRRIKREEWPEFKKSTPFGSLPNLEVDGQTLCQSRTIERFLARRFGLAGKTDLEQAKVDMILECMDDFVQPLLTAMREPDEQKKEELMKKAKEEHIPNYMKNLERFLKSNKGGDGFLVGDGLTVADISLVNLMAWPEQAGVDIKLDSFPKLKAHKERVESTPRIAQWIANRPKTAY